MKEIKPYKIEDGLIDFGIQGGLFVRDEDHAAIVAAFQEQVRALTAEANYLRNEIKQHSASVHFCEVCGKDDPCKTDDVCCSLNHPLPATETVIREIRAQAVDDFRQQFKGVMLKPTD